MNKGLIRSELKRALCSSSFLISLLIGCGIGIWHAWVMEGAPYGFWNAGDVILYDEIMMMPPRNVATSCMGMFLDSQATVFMTVLPILVSLPIAGAFWDDLNGGYVKSILTRTSRQSFLVAKLISATVAAVLITVLPYVLNLFLVSMKVPYFQPRVYGGEVVVRGGFSLWSEIYYTSFPAYFALSLLLLSIYSILFVVTSMSFAFLLDRKLLVIISPFAIWMILTTAISHIPSGVAAGLNPFYYLMLSHPCAQNEFQWLGILLITVALAVLSLGSFFYLGNKKDGF